MGVPPDSAQPPKTSSPARGKVILFLIVANAIAVFGVLVEIFISSSSFDSPDARYRTVIQLGASLILLATSSALIWLSYEFGRTERGLHQVYMGFGLIGYLWLAWWFVERFQLANVHSASGALMLPLGLIFFLGPALVLIGLLRMIFGTIPPDEKQPQAPTPQTDE